jgi:hypothetical protein
MNSRSKIATQWDVSDQLRVARTVVKAVFADRYLRYPSVSEIIGNATAPMYIPDCRC